MKIRKNKPRHNIYKRQNRMGNICGYTFGEPLRCMYGDNIKICKGNPHNCIKVKYKKEAIRNK